MFNTNTTMMSKGTNVALIYKKDSWIQSKATSNKKTALSMMQDKESNSLSCIVWWWDIVLRKED